jgi:radical SAM superfamily enzyme YgiQ (UPF0313 family)
MLISFESRKTARQVLLNLKQDSSTISLDEEIVYSFDLEGRLLSAWQNNHTHIRTLDNRIVKKWHEHSPVDSWKSIRELEELEKENVLGMVYRTTRDLLDQLESRELLFNGDPTGETQFRAAASQCLSRITTWDVARYKQDRLLFEKVYSPVSILPPDQYYALVLQATVGCHWNRCTFCDFYRDVRFHIRTAEEFLEHVRAVRAFVGEGIRLRKSIFLGDANALVTPQERLLAIFDLVQQEFPIPGDAVPGNSLDSTYFKGIYSFLDVFTGEKKSLHDFQELKSRNLKRVYVGIETGCDELLKFLNKPASSAQALEVVSAIKDSGINVGIIILAGVGGSCYFEPHVLETTDLLNALHLGKGDLVYFSPLWDNPGSEYMNRAAEAGIRPLTDEENRSQVAAIRSGLRFIEGQEPKFALYDIREFVY